ncbi:copia protein [Tanacetum coccineum]|uniref:Copia protein n=1 Tax=Tanacetum coccineum TaxID=301880 RepID=A0ABQ5I1T2_9ASTR
MDVKSAFLNDVLKEEVYVSQPESFINPDHPTHVYHLKKAIYGLKQAPRVWYNTLSRFLLDNKFSKDVVDPTLFTQKTSKHILHVQIYIDDIIFASTNPKAYDIFSKEMSLKFQMSMMGKMSFFLGTKLSLPKCTLRQLNGSFGIFEEPLTGDSDIRRTLDKLVSWSSKKQKSMAISTIEAEYIAMSGCYAQMLWMRSQLMDYGFAFHKIPLYCDNQNKVKNDVVEIYLVTTDYQLADIFPKALPRELFESLLPYLGMKNKMSEENLPAPTRSEEQLVPVKACLPYGKSNLLLDLQKLQKNPIFHIYVDILQNTNFFRAFFASANITPVDPAKPFVSSPAGQIVMDFMNEWCLTGKTFGNDKPRHTVLQMLWGIVTKTNVDYAELLWEEFVQGIQTFFTHRDSNKIPSKKPTPHSEYYKQYVEMTARKVQAKEGGKKKTTPKADKPVKPALAKQPKPVKEKISKPSPTKQSRKGKGEDYDLNRAIHMSLETFQAYGQALVGGVAIHKHVEEPTRQLPVVEGKGKAIATDEQAAQSLLALHKPKRRSTMDQLIFQRWTPATEEASIGPSTQPQDDASTNIVHDSPSPADAKTRANTDITTSTANTKVLYVEDVQGEEISHTLVLEEKTTELDEGQAGPDPGKTPESRPQPEHEHMDEDQAGPNPRQSHNALARPNPEPMHDDFIATVYPKVHESLKHTTEEHFLNDKPTEEEPGKTNVEIEAGSMVTITIHQASTSVPPLSTPIIDLSPPKPVSSPLQEPVIAATTKATTTTLPLTPPLQKQSTTDSLLASRVLTLEQRCANLEKKHKLQDQTTQALSSRIFTLELRDFPHKINQTVHEVVKEVVHAALQAPLQDRFRELPEADMKEILHQRMFESGTYKSLPEHVALYEASQAPSSSSKQKSIPHSKQPVKDVPIPDDMNISDSEDTDTTHLPKIKTRPDWLKPVSEEDRPATPEPDWVIPLNDLPETENNWANALASSYQDPDEYKLLRQTSDIIDLVNPEGHRVVSNVSKPLPLGGPPGQVTIQTQYFFNKDLEYLVSGDKGRRSALSISKLKAAQYLDFGLEELVPSLWMRSD